MAEPWPWEDAAGTTPDVRSTITYMGEPGAEAREAWPWEEKGPLEAFYGRSPEERAKLAVKGAIVNPFMGALEFGKKIVAGFAEPPDAFGLRPSHRALIEGLLQSHVDSARKAAEEWRKGNRTEAGGYAMATLLPLLGPGAAAIGEKIGAGDIEEGLGEAANLILTTSPTAMRGVARGGQAMRGAAETGWTVGKGAAGGGWETATGPGEVRLPMSMRGVPITEGKVAVPAPLSLWTGLAGGVYGGPKGAAIGALAPGVVGGLRGARTALANLRARRAAAAAPPPAAPLPELPPGPIITPPPPAPESFVRGVPGEYAQPEARPPAWQLPAAPEVIVTEPPVDPSYVRGVAGAYPEAIPPGPLRENEAALAAARALREEMGLAEGELRPPPAAVEPDISGAIREMGTREQSAQRLVQALDQFDIPLEDVLKMEAADREILASSIKEPAPSDAVWSEVLFQMRKRQTATKAATGVREAMGAKPGEYETPEPQPTKRVLTASEQRVETLAKTIAVSGIPMEDVQALGAAPLELERLAQKQGLRRPTKGEIPLIIERVRELRREAPPQTWVAPEGPLMPAAPVIPAESPISRPMVDPSLLSPSGRVSKRAEQAAKERAGREIFPEGMPAPAGPAQPTKAQALRQKAAELRDLAARGMNPRAYAREAAKLEAEAAELEPVTIEEPNARVASEHPVFRTPDEVPEPVSAGPGISAPTETKIRIPGGEEAWSAHYAVRELDSVQASHNALNFERNPRYHHRNDRDYSNPANQERIILNSQKGRFDPEYLVTDSPDAINGAPVVGENGDVLGGNSRRMILERVYRSNPEGAAAYRAALLRRAQQLGLDPAAIEGMRQPILVRELVPGQNISPQRAITELNKTGTAALTATERATADARMLSGDAAEYLGRAIEAEGADASLNDVLSGKGGAAIVNKLVEDGVFTMQEKPQLVDARTGAVTAAAKERISKMLLGQVFESADQMLRTPPEIRNKLERAVSPLLATGQKPGFELLPAVRQAIEILEYARSHGMTNLDDVVRQETMFGEAPPMTAVVLAKFLRDAKPTEVGLAFRRYVANTEPTMFGASTPTEALQDAFGAKGPRGTPVGEAKARFAAEQKAKLPETANGIGEKLGEIGEDAINRLRKRGSLSGEKLLAVMPSLEDMTDVAIWGAAKIAKGTAEFAQWSKEMLADTRAEFGPAAARAMKPQLEEIYEKAQKKYEGYLLKAADGRLPNLQRMLELYKQGKSGQEWYTETMKELRGYFGPDTEMFIDFLAATSPINTVKGNVTEALKAYLQWKQGKPFEGFMGIKKNMLEEATRGELFGGMKVQSFKKNLMGDPIPVTVDRWISRAFGFGDNPTEAQYKLMDYMITQAAKKKGIEPRQLQAAIWKTARDTAGFSGGEAFEVILRNKLMKDPVLADTIRKSWQTQGKSVSTL